MNQKINLNELESIIKNCKPDEKIEINPITGLISVVRFDKVENKRKYKKVGNIFNNKEIILPLPGKMWASAFNSNSIGGYKEFGKKLPKKTSKMPEINEKVLTGIFLTLCDFTQKPEFYTDNNNYKYTVYKCGEIKGYYNSKGSLRIIENKGIKQYITQVLPVLNTEILEKDKVNL